MTIAAEQHALVSLGARLRKRARDASMAKRKPLVGRIAVVELEGS